MADYDETKFAPAEPDYDTKKFAPVKSAVGYSSADRPIGPTPATGEMRAAPGPLATGVEETLRTGAFIGGEAGGAFLGGAGGTAVGGPAGTAIGARAGAALGAGAAGTTADYLLAKFDEWEYGKHINTDTKTLFKDFLLNAGTSAVLGGVGKIGQGGIPAEAEAVKAAATRAESAKATFTQSALGAVSPQAQREALEKTIGGSAQSATEAKVPLLEAIPGNDQLMGPSTATLAKQGGLKGAYFSVRNRLSEAYGSQYEKLLRPYNSNRITDLSPINDTLDRWEAQFTEENRPAPPPARILLNDARDLSPKSFLDTAAAKVAGPLSGPAKAALKVADKRLTPLRGEAGDIPMASSTVARILALKRAAQQTMVKTTDARSRQIAEEIADAANQTLGSTGGLPPDVKSRLGALNSQYADYKRMFPHADVKTMATAQTSVEHADHIFNNLTLADRVISNAKPEEKQILREGFSDWARNNPEKVIIGGANRQILKQEAFDKSRVYGKLFPGSPLADPNSLIYIGATLQNIEQAPQMAALFQRGLQQSQQRAIIEGASGVVAAARSAAKEIGGPVGDRITKLIESANAKGGDQAAAQAATQFFSDMTPENFVQQMATDQKLWGSSVAKTIAKPYEDNKAMYWMQRLATNPKAWSWITGISGLRLLAGGSAGFMGPIAVAGTIPVARRLMANAFVRGLKDPAVAKALLEGTKAARIGVMKPLTETLFKVAADEFGSRLAQRYFDVTLEPKAEEDEEAGGAEAAQ